MKTYVKYGMMWTFEMSIAVLVSFAYVNYIRNLVIESHKAVQHTQEVIKTIEKVRGILLSAETGQRGFLITSKEEYLMPYRGALEEIYLNIDFLEKISLEDYIQHEKVIRLKNKIYLKLNEMDKLIQAKNNGGIEEVQRVISYDVGMYLMQDCQKILDSMSTTECIALEKRQKHESLSLNIMQWSIPLIVFGNFIMLFLVYSLIREQEMSEMKSMIDTAVNQ